MVVKDVIYSNGSCIIKFRDCDFNLSIPIRDDPGFLPGDELIISDTRIWQIIRCYYPDPDSSIDIDLPFPEVYE